MSHQSDPELLVSLALRLKGFGEIDAISSVHALDNSVTQGALSAMIDENRCVMRQVEGIDKYVLTPSGREDGEKLLSAELDNSGARGAVQSGYNEFLALNPSMLQLCTDWQVVDDGSGEQKLNDHTDSAYDDEILERLGDLDLQVTRILIDLKEALTRFSNYPFRFGAALNKVLAGERDWLTKPIMPSYHTVWFELHEDLLATLGIDRASESTS
tara:strand:+ start:3681 stop:4322 length:642 start_codon:yes stop_codon:yes gene_type:complete